MVLEPGTQYSAVQVSGSRATSSSCCVWVYWVPHVVSGLRSDDCADTTDTRRLCELLTGSLSASILLAFNLAVFSACCFCRQKDVVAVLLLQIAAALERLFCVGTPIGLVGTHTVANAIPNLLVAHPQGFVLLAHMSALS